MPQSQSNPGHHKEETQNNNNDPTARKSNLLHNDVAHLQTYKNTVKSVLSGHLKK